MGFMQPCNPASSPYPLYKASLVCFVISVQAVVQILEEELGTPSLYYYEGASIPATGYFKEHLGIHTTLFAFGLDDNHAHAPNERCMSWLSPRIGCVCVVSPSNQG